MADNRDRSNASTFAALGMLILLSGLLLLLIASVMPQILGLVSVVLGIFLFCAFHYVVWGHWLSGKIKTDDDVDEAEREHLKKYGPRE